MKMKRFCQTALVVYAFFIIYMAVLSRSVAKQSCIKMDLLQCYLQPSGNSSRDVVVNIVGFIPVGTLVGFLSRRHRVAKALLAGVMISLSIEVSQLIWKKGVFDVDDIFNNAVGAVIGGAIAWFMVKSPRLRVRVLACCKRHSRAED